MRIVVTAAGRDSAAEVDPRFGRAAVFLLHDTETGAWEAHDNTQNLQAPQGAGIQSAQTVATLRADWVLTGHCGPKAFRALQAAGVRVGVGVSGTAEEAVRALAAGEVAPAGGADVEGHW
jgi:predicted Fe-Mo cluster-binding NifX family protein